MDAAVSSFADGGDDALGSMPATNTAAYAKHSVALTAFDRFASRVTRWAGSPVVFAMALASVVFWAAVGHLFHYSENWQLVDEPNTETKPVTNIPTNNQKLYLKTAP